MLSVDYRNLVMMSTLGMAVISESFKEAALITTKSSRAAIQAYAFISGTGLELTIQRFHLDYHADTLRREFYAIFKIKGA